MSQVNGITIVFGVVLLVVVVFLLGLMLNALGKRAMRPRPLKRHFVRLGQVAPDEVCPCRQGKCSKQPYRHCCRPKDIARLERDVREFLWRRWAKRSYGGRRRMRTLNQRLEDYPIPKIVLPEWVTHPENHVFPISEQLLRVWSPLPTRKTDPNESYIEDSTIDDII